MFWRQKNFPACSVGWGFIWAESRWLFIYSANLEAQMALFESSRIIEKGGHAERKQAWRGLKMGSFLNPN